MEEKIGVTGSVNARLGEVYVRIEGSTRGAMAVQHILAAAHFAKSAKAIEDENASNKFGPFFDTLIWNVSASITMACNALEANINETILDKIDHSDTPEDIRRYYQSIFSSKENGTLDKYFKFSIKNGRKIDRGGLPYQDANFLLNLRNSIVHFRPYEPEGANQIEELIKISSRKFGFNNFFNDRAKMFPMPIISYSCAKWSVHTALKFCEYFSDMSAIQNRFAQLSDRFNLP